MPYERCVWIIAVLEYFTTKEIGDLSAILGALALGLEDFQAARRALEAEIADGVRKGDLAAANRFAGELARARCQVEQAQPTLDSLRAVAIAEARVGPGERGSETAEKSADETALLPVFVPRAALPFAPGRSGAIPPSDRPVHVDDGASVKPREVSAEGETEELWIVQTSAPLPFRKK